jgi:hypothetical protein
MVDQITDIEVVSAEIVFGNEIGPGAPLAIAGVKGILEAMVWDDLRAQRPQLEAAIRKADASEDQREAGRTFMEERPRVFKGH